MRGASGQLPCSRLHGSYPETAFKEVIEAWRRGTWTINAVTVEVKYCSISPVTRLTRSWQFALPA